jgi:NAD(P)-dependent dehydrogenase (short-subunit alcohol dehydrogenase family)
MTAANVLGLEGRSALVVGGGSGIGRATALLLGDAGSNVVVADLDADRAGAVSEEVANAGVKSFPVSGDVTQQSQATEVVQTATNLLGGQLDVLINIVGFAAWSDILDLDDDTWQLDIARNLTHHLYVGRAAGRQMIEQGTGGRIAMVGSVSGIYGAPNHGAYGAAKAGAMDLARTMAQEWGHHGIRVNAVAPDMIATPRVRGAFEAKGVDLIEQARTERVTLGRFGEPKEIAGALVFLVSDLSSFITGQTIIVDGGVRGAFPHAGISPFTKETS